VVETVDRMEQTGRVDAATARRWRQDWRAARRAVRSLGGAERAHLAGVVGNTRAFARRHALAARAPLAMLTVRRNVDYFWRQRKAAPAVGTRTRFAPSRLVFQLYAGSGWQLQPLGNLGTINALSKRQRVPPRAHAWARELLAVAVRRRGAIAFEHMFPWGGGRPGWVSAMPQSVAAEAYARLGYVDEARLMLEVLRTPPPHGVRLALGRRGDHLLLYSQSPTMLVGNGFAQALLSLHAYTQLVPGDAAGRAVYRRALRRARGALGRFDTGAWSLYYRRAGSGEGQESDLHYHRLFGTFLTRLCERIGGGPFCPMAANFARYETEPVRLGPLRLRASRRWIGARVWLSKRGALTATLYRGRRALRTLRLLGARGTQRVRFGRPRAGGRFRLDLRVVSPAGLPSAASAERRLRRVRRR
jgi:hypothetical protein